MEKSMVDSKMNRIRQLRVAKGITSRKALAEELNMMFGMKLNSMSVARLEKGTTYPSMTTAWAMSRFFDVSIEYLVGLSNDPHGDGLDRHKEREAKEEVPMEVQMAMETLKSQLMAAINERREKAEMPEEPKKESNDMMISMDD